MSVFSPSSARAGGLRRTLRPLVAAIFVLAACAALAACASTRSASRASTPADLTTLPADGRALLDRMRAAYAGQWFTTVTFVQKTTILRPNADTVVQTWYEALRSPDRLRIDLGEPSAGNGMLFTGDSTYVVRGGTVVRTSGEGNPFLPFVAGVYTLPLDRTLAQLAPYGFDLTRLRPDTWRGRPVWVVGAQSATDTLSSQFWVDRDQLVLVRAILAPEPAPASAPAGTPPRPVQQFVLDNYVPLGGGWLATHVDIYVGGVLRQTEDYSQYAANMSLDPRLFDATQWSQATHWHVPRGQ